MRRLGASLCPCDLWGTLDSIIASRDLKGLTGMSHVTSSPVFEREGMPNSPANVLEAGGLVPSPHLPSLIGANGLQEGQQPFRQELSH